MQLGELIREIKKYSYSHPGYHISGFHNVTFCEIKPKLGWCENNKWLDGKRLNLQFAYSVPTFKGYKFGNISKPIYGSDDVKFMNVCDFLKLLYSLVGQMMIPEGEDLGIFVGEYTNLTMSKYGSVVEIGIDRIRVVPHNKSINISGIK